MKIISCDLETTGLNPYQDNWITGSFAILDPETLQVEDEIELKSRPTKWSREAFLIHKIPEASAMNFPERIKTLRELIAFLPKNEDLFFLCHAKPRQPNGTFFHFDFAFLKMDFHYVLDLSVFYHYFSDERVISTYTIGKRLVKQGKIGIKSMSLSSLSDYFSIKLNHHNAKSDRIAMEEIYRKFKSIENAREGLI